MSSQTWREADATASAAPQPSSATSATVAASESMQRTSSSDRRQQKKVQSRQLLSCTKCRERKVKCDRTQPCSACCARGHPRECDFVVSEGNDYTAIRQSYEIRKLRQENQRLKERLQAAQLGQSDDEDDEQPSRDGRPSRVTNRATIARQRRFRTGDRVDNLYFGTPGLANMVSDFANLQMGAQTLSHPLPRLAPQDMYAPTQSMYPFPLLWHGLDAAALAQVLPPHDETLEILDLFQQRAQSCAFPHTPEVVSRREVERFLADVAGNAVRHADMLALVFTMLATGLQMGQYDRDGGQWVKGAVAETALRSDVFIAASMQALRLASFMNQPTLLGVQTLIMMGPYLTNSGRFLDAWTLFGTTVRMAHSIGLHRNPKLLDPVPSLRECMVRQSMWWWMLHMDHQYSVALGRPLGISGYGDCPPPEPLTTNQELRRLGQFIHSFTVHARQILASDVMSVTKIDEFTDKLIGLWDTMPAALQFNESWLQPDTKLPDWPLDVVSANLYASVQSYLVLLNRQRVERTQSAYNDASPPGSFSLPSARPMEHVFHPAAVRGRSLVINSSASILQAFLFFHYRNPGVLICWNISQQAFNATMVLLLDAMEMDHDRNMWLVNQAFVVFSELEAKGVHELASLAVKRLSDGLGRLGKRHKEREEQQQEQLQRQQQRQQHQQQQHQQDQFAAPVLSLDTAAMNLDWSGDTVMGNTGYFLLEDSGLQNLPAPPFHPLTWNMAGGGLDPENSARQSAASSPTDAAPAIPVSKIEAAPFPIISEGTPYPIRPIGAPLPFDSPPMIRAPQSQRRRSSGRAPSYPPQQWRPLQVHPTPYNPQQQGQTQGIPLSSTSAVTYQQTFTPINAAVPGQSIQPFPGQQHAPASTVPPIDAPQQYAGGRRASYHQIQPQGYAGVQNRSTDRARHHPGRVQHHYQHLRRATPSQDRSMAGRSIPRRQ